MADVLIPKIVQIYEGGAEISNSSFSVGETYQIRLQLIGLTGIPEDISTPTLTHSIYNSSGVVESTAGSITKDINELGIIELSSLSWGSAGTKNLYITSTNAGVIKKYGPYRVQVRAL